MVDSDPHHPKAFISYSHDSLEHSDRVREFSDRLLADGIDCILDQYEVSPPEGWPRWMDKQIRDADFVLMICTEIYYRRVMGEDKPGTGLGVRWEGNLIYQHIYNPGTVNAKFIPVLLESSRFEHIPTPVQGVNHYFAQTEEGYEELYRRLTKQPRHFKPKLGEVRRLVKLRKLQPLEPKERKHDFFAAQLTNLPFERNPFFTGREMILKDLHVAFTKKTASSHMQALSGLGGLGKTQTAIEYAYLHRDDYKAVFWVRADSHLALITGFVEIARILDLPERDAPSADDSVRAVSRWLETNSGWLIIFDNADVPELLKRLRPRGAKGHVLLTSRAQVFDTLGITNPLEIKVMLPGEAVAFLLIRTGRDGNNVGEREAAAKIAEDLGYLPLALEQAGAFITAKQARFQDYLAAYRKRHLELLKEAGPVTGDYPQSVATTWVINFREVENVSEAASDLLRASAFLSPDRIPLELITEARLDLGSALSAALADLDDNPLALNEVLEPLTRYSFIRLDSDLQTYSIHRLVQEVLRDEMDADTQRVWAKRNVLALIKAFPAVEFNTWPLCERLLPHAKAAAKLIEKWDFTFEAAGLLLNEGGVYCYMRGEYSDAEWLYKLSLTVREKASGPDHLDVALVLSNLAELYREQGKYEAAEALGKRSLAIREKVLEPDHPSVGVSLNNLAALYHDQAKYDEAEPLYKRSLRIREKALGQNHPDVATCLNNLADLYRAQGKYAEAEPLIQRSLALFEAAFGPDHPNVASSLNTLATLCYSQGKYSETDTILRRSLTIRERTLGSEHPTLAATYNNLAQLYSVQSKYIEAEHMFHRSLEISEKSFGSDHPDVASTLENYAFLLAATERGAEAAKMGARAAAIRAKNVKESALER